MVAATSLAVFRNYRIHARFAPQADIIHQNPRRQLGMAERF
jgi:hypothetical protein